MTFIFLFRFHSVQGTYYNLSVGRMERLTILCGRKGRLQSLEVVDYLLRATQCTKWFCFPSVSPNWTTHWSFAFSYTDFHKLQVHFLLQWIYKLPTMITIFTYRLSWFDSFLFCTSLNKTITILGGVKEPLIFIQLNTPSKLLLFTKGNAKCFILLGFSTESQNAI